MRYGFGRDWDTTIRYYSLGDEGVGSFCGTLSSKRLDTAFASSSKIGGGYVFMAPFSEFCIHKYPRK